MLGDFDSIYHRYSGPLLRFIYRFAGTQEAAEEILHDVFVEYLAGKFVGDSDGQLKSWLFTLAKNKSLNYLDRARRMPEPETSTVESPEEILVTDRRDRRFAAVEATLPDDLRTAWSLRKQGMDYQQIAIATAVPLGTVKSRFSRLVSYFRKELADE
jgi:RNA polymerase sigma-70 factor, ECF subfamily